MNFLKKNLQTLHAGFTLVEFIVIISIFAVIAGVSFFNFAGFSTRISLENLAQDVALTIRQAQTYGLSATELLGQAPTRGVFFKHAAGGGYEDSFIIFQDTSTICSSVQHECRYDSQDLVVDTITIQTGDRIKEICVGDQNGTTLRCNTSDVSITFTRPDPKASIRTSSSGLPDDYAYVSITIESLKGVQKFVEVWRTGQINVK